MRAAQFLISERYQCVCVAVPKAASTTLTNELVTLHSGLPRLSKAVRNAMRKPGMRQRLADQGFQQKWFHDDAIEDAVRKYQGYYFFTFVRDPYSRLLSGYRNRLNRYARYFNKRAYYLGKLYQVLEPLKGRYDRWHSVFGIRRLISFSELVHGLARNGVDFDRHFCRQTDLVCPDVIPYNFIGKIETLTVDLVAIKRELGIEADDDQPTQKLNSTGGALADYYTDGLKMIVADLYRADFDNFKYAA
jgi:hypothetical protein